MQRADPRKEESTNRTPIETSISTATLARTEYSLLLPYRDRITLTTPSIRTSVYITTSQDSTTSRLR